MISLQLSEKQRAIVQEILNQYSIEFYVFGSRIKGTAKRLSDLDLCYKIPVKLSEITQIREAFEESDLPFEVDIIDWNNCAPEFQAHIADDLVLLGPLLG
ncbi:MAG: nucleotidyltransferase [marine bacterium B5-7]|nr:MAG: nucleotidyltransferase [marine bacterium B5-7]